MDRALQAEGAGLRVAVIDDDTAASPGATANIAVTWDTTTYQSSGGGDFVLVTKYTAYLGSG